MLFKQLLVNFFRPHLKRLSFSASQPSLLTQEYQCLAVRYLENGFVAVFFALWHSPWALVNRCSHCCFLSLFLSDMNFFARRRFSLACRILKDNQNASLSSMRQGHQWGSLIPLSRPKFSLNPVIPVIMFEIPNCVPTFNPESHLHFALKFWSRLSNKLNTGSRGLFGHPVFRAYFRSRISPPFCFKIPIPGLHRRQIPGPEGYFGHPALRAYLKSRISTPFCFKISKPAFKWAKSQFPTNRLGLSIKYRKSGRLSPGGIRSPRHQRNRGQEI